MFDLHLLPAARVVLEHGAARITGAALARRAVEWARALRGAGLRAGDRVATRAVADPEWVALVFGAHAAGLCLVPVSDRYREAEAAHVLSDSGARVWIGDPAPPVDLPHLRLSTGPAVPTLHARPVPPPLPHARGGLVVYTSGTTGPSKGALLLPRALAGGIGALADLWRIGPSDRLSLCLPLYHVHGLLVGLYGALARGACVRLHDRFEPQRVADDFATHGTTLFFGVPTMYVDLVTWLEAAPERAAQLSGARLFTAGSAALRPDLARRFQALTGHAVLERYGMTETLISLSQSAVGGSRRVGTVGRPVPGYEMRIVDGELRVRGPGLMHGYLGRPADTAAAFVDGFFCTGDVVALDPDGQVRIVGRRSTDIVKSGGFKIATAEIEAVLVTHPAVREVAVVGVTDARWGERIVAVVVPRPEHAEDPEDVWLARLSAHAAAQLADYKKPRQVLVIDALPRTALGKVMKTELRRRLEGG